MACIRTRVAAPKSYCFSRSCRGHEIGRMRSTLKCLRVRAQMLSTAEAEPLVVMLAIYENGLVSKIGAGENTGRKLRYDYTVRRLLARLNFDSAQAAMLEKELKIDLDRSWSVDHIGVAAFIQDIASRRILGAATEYPIAKD